MAMTISVTLQPGHAHAVLTGEIDGRTAPEVQAKLVGLAEAHPSLLLDMQAVTFLSSAGLRMLLLLYRHFSSRSGEVVLAGVPEEIRDTMAMTGFSNFFTFVENAGDIGRG